jgi:zinc/manganese transport system permease protein
MRVASGPISIPALSVVFAVVSIVGGTLLSLAGALPISPFVTTISFAIYVVCRIVAAVRGRSAGSVRLV